MTEPTTTAPRRTANWRGTRPTTNSFSPRPIIWRTFKTKLFWVSAATTTVAAGKIVGTQYDYPPAGPYNDSIKLQSDVAVNDSVINCVWASTTIAVGNQVVVYQLTPPSSESTKYEIKTVTSVTYDNVNYVTIIGVAPNMTQAFAAVNSSVETPVTLRRIGQNIVPLDDDSQWRDPDWSSTMRGIPRQSGRIKCRQTDRRARAGRQ